MDQAYPASSEATSACRQFTLRAAATGAMLGALLVPCNVYSGLKIGWSFNMSIAAALLSMGFWGLARRGLGDRVPPWGLLENNINQTAASSAASIISSGLVAPIPALAILTGVTLDWPTLSIWLLTVSLIGVLVGLALRRQMLEVQQLPFPAGAATAETVREIYAAGSEAATRIRWLLGGGLLSGGVKLTVDLFARLTGSLPQLGPAVGLGAFGLPTVTTRSLGFLLDPSLLMVGFGAICGLRVGLSMLLGAVLAWGILAPWLFASGRLAIPAETTGAVFGEAVEFLLWPGVAMMVVAALVSFGYSLPGFVWSLMGGRQTLDTEGKVADAVDEHPIRDVGPGIPWSWLAVGLLMVTVGTTVAQTTIFGISPWMGVLAVALTFVLAVVAARVSGETGIPPIGALGKVTQLTFGLINPASVTENLMTANVTGGAAGQCSDLLHDLKTGLLLGASVRAQALAQCLGVLVGSLAGSAAYLVLVPDPAAMLLTPEWPAPAVATWMAVAELFRDGLDAAPQGVLPASLVGGVAGAALAVLQHHLPRQWAVVLPSPVSIGLAFVIPAWNSLSLFAGAVAAEVATRSGGTAARRLILPVAAGLVAGESLTGVGTAIFSLVLGRS
jgi:putative OPT family oligopeptide transporter